MPRNTKKRLYTWHEAVTSVREGAGDEAVTEFEQDIVLISSANIQMRRLKEEKERAVARALVHIKEYIGADAQIIGPDGDILERQEGVSVSYPVAALIAAGVTEEQIAQARKETRWETVAGARK